jgi:hypothetical protein
MASIPEELELKKFPLEKGGFKGIFLGIKKSHLTPH